MSISLLAPESSEEDLLRDELAGFDALAPDTKQALRAAEALFVSQQNPEVAVFLYGKALEIEISAVLMKNFERHNLLPQALLFTKDPRALADAAKAAALALEITEKEAMRRAEQLVDSVVKNRVSREIADWRSLALALCVFGTAGLLPEKAGGRDLARSQYRAERLRSTPEASPETVEQARSLCLSVLAGLSGIKTGRAGAPPLPPD